MDIYKLFKNIYELKNNSSLDGEEEWIINNCMPLFIIEQASEYVEQKIRTGPKIEKTFLKILDIYDPTGVMQLNKNAIRIVKVKDDIPYDNNKIDEDDPKYMRAINSISKSLEENTNYKEENEFVMILSLGFSVGGGHFCVVYGKFNNKKCNVYILDQYESKYYYPAFSQVFKTVFDTYNKYGLKLQIENLNTHRSKSLQSMTYVTGEKPTNSKEEIEIQKSNNQDHFCFMWCIMFFHLFIEFRTQTTFSTSIKKLKDLLNSMIDTSNSNKKLTIIKSYLLYSVEKYSFVPKNLLLNNIFKYMWFEDTSRTFNVYELDTNFDDRLKLPDIISAFSSRKVTDNDIINLLNPKLQSGIEIKTRNKKLIINSITDKNIKDGLKDDDSLIKVIFFYLKSIKLSNITNPDKLYTEYFNTSKSLLNNIPLTCDKKYAKKIYNELYLSDYETSIVEQNCRNAQLAVTTRNDRYNDITKNFNCKIPTNLKNYQTRVVEIMIDKIKKDQKTSTRGPGLLLWYGTGSGKTFAASTVTKMLGYCYKPEGSFPFIKNIIIISPLSAFTNFKNELENEGRFLNIFLNKFPVEMGKESYFYSSGNMNIYIFSHSGFKKLFKDPETDMVNNTTSTIFNKDMLKKSLLIIDECHNFANIESDQTKTDTKFVIDCCKNVKQILLLSATPIQNSTNDIETILAMLDGRDIMNIKEFKRLYTGTYTNFSVGTTPITETNLTSIPTDFSKNNIQSVPDKLYLNTEIFPLPELSKKDIKKYFENRIIEYSNTTGMPKYKEKIYFIQNVSTEEKTHIVNTFILSADRDKTKLTNKEALSTNSFGVKENKYIWNSTNVKQEALMNLIINREQRFENQELTDPLTTKRVNYNVGDKLFENSFYKKNKSYKYIIYCNYKKNISDIRKTLIGHGLKSDEIGIIDGETEVNERKKNAHNYDLGIIRFMIISKAGEEGVDFKRTGLLILADPVWTPSEYEQILGRAVRLNSNTRIVRPPKIEDPNLDKGTPIPKILECYTILFTLQNSDKYSYDLLMFKNMLRKRAMTKKFLENIKDYFYKI